MYFRVKQTGSYSYLQIVRSQRVDGRVRQQVLTTLGRLDVLQQSGQLDRLMRSGLRHCEKISVLDAHAAGQTEPVSIRSIGPDLVFGRLWAEAGLPDILNGLLEGRRFGFDVERAVYLTVLHRLFASGSDRAAERWQGDYRIPGGEELGLHQIYRAMEWMGEPLAEKENLLGSPRCTKDLVEEALFDRDRDLFSGVDVVFFDTTSIYFEGEGGATLGQRGHSKDGRPDLKQMIVGIAMDAKGKPLCCEMWPGNTADAKTLLPVVDRMKMRFRIREVGIVADRGMISDASIAAMEASDPPVRYILGARMRGQKEVRDTVLNSRGLWLEVEPERKTSKDPSPLKIREVQVEGRRYIVCLNEEQRRKEEHDRAAITESLRKQLKQGAKSLVGNKGYRRYLKTAARQRLRDRRGEARAGGPVRRAMGVAHEHGRSSRNHRPFLQDALDGGRPDPHDQVDHGNPPHLPQAGRNHPGSCVLQLSGPIAEDRSGAADARTRPDVGVGRGHPRAGPSPRGGGHVQREGLRASLGAHWACPSGHKGGACLHSAHAPGTGTPENVVPTPGAASVSSYPSTAQVLKL